MLFFFFRALTTAEEPIEVLREIHSVLENFKKKHKLQETLSEEDRFILTKWIPEIINIFAVREFTGNDPLRVNALIQQVIHIFILYLRHDVSESLQVFSFSMNYQEYHFYKKYVHYNSQPEGERISFFVQNVRFFRDKGGPKAILNRLFSTSPKVDVNTATQLLIPMLRAKNILSGEQFNTFAITATDAIFGLLQSMSDDELKAASKETTLQLLFTTELLYRFVRPEKASEIFENFRLNFALKCFNSPYLAKRLQGLADIKAFITQVKSKQLYLDQTSREGDNSNKSSSHEPKDPCPLLWMSSEWLVEWIQDHSIIEIMYGPALHPEVLKRGIEIPVFLASSKVSSFGSENLNLIWNASLNKHESIRHLIHTQLTNLAGYLRLNELESLCDSIKKYGCANYDSILLNLIHNLSIPAIQFQAKLEGPHTRFGLELLWEILQDSPAVSLSLVESALNSLRDFLKWDLCHSLRPIFLNRCLDCLVTHKSVPAAVQLIVRILKTYDVSEEDLKDTPAQVITWLNNDQNRMMDLFFADLQHYKQTVVAKAQALQSDGRDLHNDTRLNGIFTHESQIRHRLDFLLHVYRNSDLFLSMDQIRTFWDCLIVNPLTLQEQDMGFDWLKGIRSTPTAPVCGLSNEAVRFLFCECLEKFPIRTLSTSGYSLLETHFILLNSLDERLSLQKFEAGLPLNRQQQKGRFVVNHQELIGYELLYHAATTCTSSQVGQKSIQFLIELQRHVSPTVGGHRFFRESLINHCMDSLAQCAQRVKSPKETTGRDGLFLVMERCVTIIQELLSNFQATPKKDERPLLLRIRAQPAQNFEIKTLSGSSTVGALRVQVAEILGNPHPDLIRLITSGQELKDDSARLVDCRVTNGQLFLVNLRPGPPKEKPIIIGSQGDQNGGDPESDPSVILSRQNHFSRLFEVLNVGDRVGELVWDLICSLPTNSSLQKAMCSSQITWEEALPSHSLPHLLYYLRNVNEILDPFDSPLQVLFLLLLILFCNDYRVTLFMLLFFFCCCCCCCCGNISFLFLFF